MRLALLALVLCAVLVPTATAAASQRLIGPANGAVLPLGVPPTFVVWDTQPGMATLEVSASRLADANGVFNNTVWSTGYDSRPGGRKIRISPQRSSSRRGFWTEPGTYYWHITRVECPFTGPRPHTCAQHATTRTRSFRITSATTRTN